MKRFIFFCLIWVSYLGLSAQEIGFPFLRNYAPKEYTNTPQIFSMAQDSNGLLYFGVDNGVMEYDGKKWSLATPTPLTVYSLAKDAKDVLYVGSINDFGYVKVTPTGKKEFSSLKHLIKETAINLGAVTGITITKDKIYFLGSAVICEYTPPPIAKVKTYFAQKGNKFSSLLAHHGKIYVHEKNRGLLQVGADSLELVSEYFKDIPFKTAMSLSKDSIVIASRTQGLYVYNPITSVATNFSIQQNNFFADNSIYTSHVLPQQTMALGSTGQGLLLISKQGTTLQTMNESNLLQDNSVGTIYATTATLWLGLSNGITRTDATTAWTYWDKYAGLKGKVTAILRTGTKIYCATSNGIYYLEQGIVKKVTGIVAGQCWDLLEYVTPTNQKIRLAGTQNGIYEIKGEKATLIYKDDHIFRFYRSKINPNRIFVGKLASFMSMLYENGKWKVEGKWDGISSSIQEISEDANGELWLGSFASGIIRVTPNLDSITKPKQVKFYKKEKGLPVLTKLIPYQLQGKTVVGTEKGLYVYNPKTDSMEISCTLNQKMCAQDSYKIGEFKAGKVWIVPFKNQNQDMGYLKGTREGSYEWVYKPFRKLPQMELNCVYEEVDGVTWIGGSEGLFRYDEKQDTKNYEAAFYTLIRKVTITNDSVMYHGGALMAQQNTIPQPPKNKLPYSYNDIKFEFAAPFFDDETKTMYSYKLEGFDENWSAWASEGTAIYTNLHEGTYTFKVKAKNVYDVESELATYSLTILPPYYRTWWAYSLYTILAIFTMVGIVKWNTKRLQEDKQQLELLVKQRTFEIEQKKDEIQGKNIALEQQQEEIMMQNEELHQQAEEITAQRDFIAHTNEELAHQYSQINKSVAAAKIIQDAIFPFRERVSQFLPNYFAFYRPKDVVSGDFYWIEYLDDKIFMAVVDCTGHGVPGAFMSMIANTLLDHIIKVQRIFSPEKVLLALNEEVHSSLKQKDTDNNNGMDLAFVCIEKQAEHFLLAFAGAKRPLYYVEAGTNEVLVCKGTKNSIGGKNSFDREFTRNDLLLPYESTFYLFSDGYADQCNAARKAFGSSRMIAVLKEVSQLPVTSQATALATALDEFRENTAQRDDILLVGVKVEK